MRHFYYTLGMLLLLGAMALPTKAQVASDDNEDGVVKIDANRAKYDYVQGQILVKFKDANRVQVNASRGQFRSTSIDRVTQVLQKYGTDEMEQLLPNENPNRKMRCAKAYNGDVIQESDLSQLYLVKLSADYLQETMQMVDELSQLDEVEFAEPNYRLYAMADDNIAADYSGNPYVSQQWYLEAYGVKQLWNKPIINSERPVIAIIDTGVDITHPDLKDNIWTNPGEVDGQADYDNDRNGFKNDVHGWDFINNTPKMRDNNKHGTHVAGIAAAANNGIGIVGANPRALIMPVTVMQSDGTGDVATIVRGVDYAVKNGATVLNMSIGTYANSLALRQALEKAYQSAVIVAAAGNDGRCINTYHFPELHKIPVPKPCFPAAYSFVLGVQAMASGGELAPYSNYDDDGPIYSCGFTAQDPDGFNYELKAPGTQILSCIPGGGYQVLHGTSMASPLVAGAISTLMMVKQYENQLILWSDLLYTTNIAEAYNVVNRPAELDLMRIVLRDRNEKDPTSSIKPMCVNTGEEVRIFPVIRNSFGKASHIRMKVIASNGVEIVTSEADFGFDLDVFGKMTSMNPLVIKVPNDLPNGSTINVTVQATCDESQKTFSKTFTLNVITMYTLKGLLTEDKTLTPDHIYYVTGRFGINNGVTLTIKPGTRLEFAVGAGIYIFGKLVAKGTPEAPIIFTSFDKSGHWAGVYSHAPSGKHYYGGKVYTNADKTLFTLLPTEDTPIEMSQVSQGFYYDTEDNKPISLTLEDYVENWSRDMTSKDHLLTDPGYLTPAVLNMLNKWNSYFQKYPVQPTGDMKNYTHVDLSFSTWEKFDNPTDTLFYCKIDGCPYESSGGTPPIFYDCILNLSSPNGNNYTIYPYVCGERNVVAIEGRLGLLKAKVNHTNFVNNILSAPTCLANHDIGENDVHLGESNILNNFMIDSKTGKKYMIEVLSRTPVTVEVDPLPYLGTGREDILRPLVYEYGNTDDYTNFGKQMTYASLDLSNIRKEPSRAAHGIVWKVLVNGIDPQDEYEKMLPLGVGRHKFEVYFNRPMNKAVEPDISFGPFSPYTKQIVAEDCSWNDEGTIYTAYVTIDGKTQCDGMNRIYVRGAEDNEFFECPYESTRFNIMVQAAGRMASGFQADAGLGCVWLTWNNENNDFEDAMGFNVYRYTVGGNGVNDTIRINENTLDITETSYIDDNVQPGQTYYYYYKVLSTALQEYDVSNVVAATPLTATRGDANGSGEVDVADIITTVNYITGLQPKPFVFDAADMNSDQLIDVHDVVGIIRGILTPSLLSTASVNDESAIYTIEDGVLYVESPVALAGVQAQLSLDGRSQKDDVRVAADLEGFEQASAWLTDNDYLFMAYSMSGKTLAPGKHALLYIGDADLSNLRLSDTQGHNVPVVAGEGTTKVDAMGSKVMTAKGIYNLNGQKLNSDKLRKGIYIINGIKVVK